MFSMFQNEFSQPICMSVFACLSLLLLVSYLTSVEKSCNYLVKFSYRFLFPMNQFEKNETDLEGGKLLKDGDKATRGNKVVKSQNQALLAGLAYCISSCSMILVNKFVLSSYNFDAGISLMLYQVITLLILFISSRVCICFPPDDIKRGFFLLNSI